MPIFLGGPMGPAIRWADVHVASCTYSVRLLFPAAVQYRDGRRNIATISPNRVNRAHWPTKENRQKFNIFSMDRKSYQHTKMLPIFLGGPMGPIHPAWGHVSLASASSFLEVFAYSDTRQDADLHLEVQEHSSAVPHANARQAPLQ